MPCKVTLITGPAGSGKTTRCVREVVEALKNDAGGKPLVFLLPRQSTFQIEQAVYGGDVPGSTRLEIVSFERFSQFLLGFLGENTLNILQRESRAMLVEGILSKYSEQLRRYRDYASDSGLAQGIVEVISQFQRLEKTPAFIREQAEKLVSQGKRSRFANKLFDIALIYEEYQKWLQSKNILDESNSLEQVSRAVNRWHQAHPNETLIDHLWFDGFAELSLQELELLKNLSHVCGSMSLAFCLEQGQGSRSFWKYILPLFQKCKACFEGDSGCEIEVVSLSRNRELGRFSKSQALESLERNWLSRGASLKTERPMAGRDIEVCACAGISDEAVFVARKIREFVRNGGRYRECFVAFRNMAEYESSFRRVFRRYQIPFFLDVTQSITHHPAAELTLQILKTVDSDWKNEDLFAILKTELAGLELENADRLENEFIKHNDSGIEFWKNEHWNQWKNSPLAEELQSAKVISIAPLLKFTETLKKSPKISGRVLSSAIRQIWKDYQVGAKLERWSVEGEEDQNFAIESGLSPRMHKTVWERMNRWLENLNLAFLDDAFDLQRWIEIVETGLAELSVSAIPPSVDQVVLGDIDRSRSPSVRLTLLPAMNDDVFPFYQDEQTLFSRDETEYLQKQQAIELCSKASEKTIRENYLSYIALTRPSEKLVVTYSLESKNGSQTNPSRYIETLQSLFVDIEIQKFSAVDISLENCLSRSELAGIPALYQDRTHLLSELLKFVESSENTMQAIRGTYQDCPSIPAGIMDRFYGDQIRLSTSKLESYAECPFRFFAQNIARGAERKQWDLGADKLGSLAHKTLDIFHRKATQNSSWCDVLKSDQVWRKMVEDAVHEASKEIFVEDQNVDFTSLGGDSKLKDTEERVCLYLEKMKEYFSTYQFDPTLAEMEFGKGKDLSWEIPIGDKTLYMAGRIDRVDVFTDPQRNVDPQRNDLWVAVIDYKPREYKFNEKDFEAGIRLQLITYLCAIRGTNPEKFLEKLRALEYWPSRRTECPENTELKKECLKNADLKIAGAFYLNLKKPFLDQGKEEDYKHRGRFNRELLKDPTPFLDQLGPKKSATFEELQQSDNEPELKQSSRQFSARITRDNGFHGGDHDPVSPEELEGLIERAKKIIQKLAEQILQGQFPIKPCSSSNKSPCEYCQARVVCRFDLRREKISKIVPVLFESESSSKKDTENG